MFIMSLEKAVEVVNDYSDFHICEEVSFLESLEWMEACIDDLDNEENAALHIVKRAIEKGELDPNLIGAEK